MPPPHRSQSSPNLRTPSSQGLGSRFPLPRSSMAGSEPFARNASIRRFNSRRPRPTVVSIADIFVGSLVMAGYCHEHSPRGRGMSTIAVKTSGGQRGGLQQRRALNTRQLPRQRLEYLGSPGQRLGPVQTSKSYQMFSSGVAQRVEDDENEAPPLSKRETGMPSAGHGMELNRCEHADESSQGRASEASRVHPPKSSIKFGDMDRGADDNLISENESVNRPGEETSEPVRHHYKGRKSPRVSLLRSTKKVFAQAFGGSLDCDSAVRSVVDDKRVAPGPGTDETQDATDNLSVQKLLDALWDETKSNHYIFRLYRDLPHPGVACLSKRSRGALLRRFANPPNRRWVDARRYLALVEDMIYSKLPMSRSLWSSAIHLAGRASGNVIKTDLVRSIGIWQQMEHLGGIRGDGVVFTILFDIAIKAGQFTVADRLVEEMTRRKISFGRTGKVSKIYYYGMLKDPEGIHQTFDEFVSSGEIVDTAVLNCLLVSFLRAGETETAQQLYRRMIHGQKTGKQHHIHGPGYTSELIDYRDKAKRLNRVLQLSSSLKDQLPEHHRALQKAFPMVPDTRTFHILLSHHAYQTGSLESFMSTLKDMEMAFTIPPRGMIYLLLFDGFAHNGRKRKGWTSERLQETWRAYLAVLYESRARYNERFHKPGTLVWQNPLESGAPGNSRTLTRAPSGLYTPLPSKKVEKGDSVEEKPQPTAPEQSETGTTRSTADASEEVDTDELLDKAARDSYPEPDHLTILERQIENGVFLGRRMIIIILRAFGTCCGPRAVMEVWLRMEKLWQPQKRKALDVQAVREELDYQINRRQQ